MESIDSSNSEKKYLLPLGSENFTQGSTASEYKTPLTLFSYTATSDSKEYSVKNSVRDEFLELASKWRKETRHYSTAQHMFMNQNYQYIIGMGRDVVPVLLNELKNNPDHWFQALSIITKENPIKPEHRGKFNLMCSDWIEWGVSKGYLI